MSAKVKLISFISAFILVLGIMIIGVLSAEQVQVNIGGSVSFNATNVYAKVSGNISGAETGNKTFSTLTYSAEETTGDESDWTNLALEFTETPDPIIITITVENLSTQRTLTANLTNSLSASGLNIAVTRDNGIYTSGTNVELPVSTGDGSSTTTFTLTLTVANPDQSLADVNFGYILNMYDESSVPVVTYQPFRFEVIEGTENEVRITRHGGSGDVVIPATFSLGNTIPLTSFIMQDFNGSDLSLSQMVSIYLGEFYYTETGGERTKTNMIEFFSMEGTLTPPITVEPTYRYEFEGYSEINAMLLSTAIIAPSEVGYTDNINYYLTNDDFARQAFTTEEMVSYITKNYPNAESDPTTLAPLFSTTGSTILETDPIGSMAIIEGRDYVVTEIGDSAFESCRGLTSITIPEGVTSIGSWAFQACSNLTSITIPEGVTRISDGTFQGCSNLTSITIPSSVTSIGGHVFYGCDSLTSITIPEGVTSISSAAFVNCDSLTTIEVDPANTTYSSEDGVLFNKDKTTLIQYPIGNTRTSYTIPSSVTIIDNDAFSGCSSLTSVDFGENSNLTTIDNDAFNGCRNLTSITIPESVTTIGDYAFDGCGSLNEVTIESDNIYLALTSQSACGRLINYITSTGETVKVLKSVVDSVETDITANPVNTYLNGSNFKMSPSEDGRYYVYTHI